MTMVDATLKMHPGTILMEEFLRPLGFTPSNFAEELGLPANRITGIVNGTRRITGDTALILAATFETTAQFWINLQAFFDLEEARENENKDRMERAHNLYKRISVKMKELETA